jgi:hypothetical protein
MIPLTAAETGRALAYPITQVSVLLALLMFWGVLEVVMFAGIFGLFFAILLLPALPRYLMLILEARSRGKHPEPIDVDLFLWFSGAWGLFPSVWIAVLIYTAYIVGSMFGGVAALAAQSIILTFMPASLSVLAVTHSPIESLNPRAVGGLIRRAGGRYLVAVAYAIVAAILVWWIAALPLPDYLRELIVVYLVFAFFTLVGEVVRPLQLHQEVDIHDPTELGAEEIGAALSVERTSVLNHAYGFVSRGNRAGGLQHIAGWLEKDPEPQTAWAWFFEQMLQWEVHEPALVFAQQYLSRLLQNEESVTAVKVMLRCRMMNEAFKPLEQDTALAIEAANRCDNTELASFLERL